jgi:hypothetical protein
LPEALVLTADVLVSKASKSAAPGFFGVCPSALD